MQEIATYLNDNFARFQISKRQFTNQTGETVNYDQLQIVTGINERERAYDVKLSRDSKVLLRAESTQNARKIDVNQE